jgi:hypothetical protein
MHFQTLPAECDAPDNVRGVIHDLIAKKGVTRGLRAGELPAPTAAFIDAEFATAPDAFGAAPAPTMA